MKIISLFIVVVGLCIISCSKNKDTNTQKQYQSNPMIGTWKLISGTTIKGKDTIITNYTKEQEMIKIINKTHFAFLRHDLKKGSDSTAIFVAGGGKYTLKGNTYTEHLDYCNFRAWEGNSFELKFEIEGDTLITKGIEKIENLEVNHLNIEKFYRVID